MENWIIFDVIVLVCVIIFIVIGFWALFRKTPMHFWAGTTVKLAKEEDVKRYNIANAKIWFCYSLPYIISMIIAPFNLIIATIILGVSAIFGIIPCIFAYNFISKKYRAISK